MPTRSMASRAMARSDADSKPKELWCGVRPIRTSSPARKGKGTCTSWGTVATRAASARRVRLWTGRPPRVTRPESGRRLRVAARTRLVLPAPLQPSKPTTSPRPTLKLTPFKTPRPPKRAATDSKPSASGSVGLTADTSFTVRLPPLIESRPRVSSSFAGLGEAREGRPARPATP